MLTISKEHKRLCLVITTDGYSITVNTYDNRDSAHEAMENEYNSLNQNTPDDEWDSMSCISDNEAILYANGENVFVWKIVEIVSEAET